MTRIDGKFLQADYVQEVPSGTVNGSNVTFTLANTPVSGSFVALTLNGLMQRVTTDYTISGVTITFVTAPATDSDVYAEYWKKN